MVSMVFAIGFLALSFIAFVPTTRASMDLSGQGNLMLTGATLISTTPIPGTDLIVYHFRFVGIWYGTISGPAIAESTVTETATAGTHEGGSLNIVGNLTCDPCTVGGLTGSLKFSGALNGIEAKPPIPGGIAISIIGATGDLTGMSGSGSLTFIGGVADMAANFPLPYTIAITQP